MPSGYRADDGNYVSQGDNAVFWSTSSVDESTAKTMFLQRDDDGYLNVQQQKIAALSVRCIKASLRGAFTDTRDDQTYGTVRIKNQVWMAENLNYAYTEPTAELDSSSFCYDNDAANCTASGRLYLWSAAMDSAGKFTATPNNCGDGVECALSGQVQGVCPNGWHLPDYAEWETLFTSVGGLSTSGTKLKSTSGWSSDGNGTDDFGFSARPAGYWGSSSYVSEGSRALFWSSTEYAENGAYEMGFVDSYYEVFRGSLGAKNYAFSVRCVLD